MSRRRCQAFEKAPENSWEHRGGTEKRPASARSARARAPRENSLQHLGVLGEPRTTASTHLTHHRRGRKAACTIAKPPQGPERSLHHRQANAGTGKQLAPPPSHRQASDNSSKKFARTAFSDSAFRFLSRQVLCSRGGVLGLIFFDCLWCFLNDFCSSIFFGGVFSFAR